MDHINVAIRVRPLNAREISQGQTEIWSYTDKTITQYTPQGRVCANYTFGMYMNYQILPNHDSIF
jgi:hypothetical protein